MLPASEDANGGLFPEPIRVKKPHIVSRRREIAGPGRVPLGARMQMMAKAKYKGPIVSRYCAVAGKIKVAGLWARGPYVRLHPEKHTTRGESLG